MLRKHINADSGYNYAQIVKAEDMRTRKLLFRDLTLK